MRSDNSGVSERLFQEGVQYFVNHPDKWISRRELQEALGIKKTQACTEILNDKQKLYAATDAWACINIYNELIQLAKNGNYHLIIKEEDNE